MNTPGVSSQTNSGPYRVMVVDDSAVIRGLLTRALESDSRIKVVASVGNGQLAVDNVRKNAIEIIVLDIEMPVMDGLTALPLLIKEDPALKIIMASTLTLRNAEISIQAMEAGAADYIPKPTSTREISGDFDFKGELVAKVLALGLARRGGIEARPGAVYTPRAGEKPAPVSIAKPLGPKEIVLRPLPASFSPRVLAIGSSTGGPQALAKVMGALSPNMTLPILITQHMPATFTQILAEHLGKLTKRPAGEGREGEIVKSGHIYVAPGGFHMVVAKEGGDVVIRLNQDPPENFCRPAVDPMFRSISAAYGTQVLSVILTGMGVDGAKGGDHVVSNGGVLVAQDEKSSVVWGMPGAAAATQKCSAVLPIEEIGGYINKTVLRTAA